MAQRKRATIYSPDMIRRARELAATGETPTGIYRKLELLGFELGSLHVNTIKGWIGGARDADPTPAWSLGSRDGGPDPDPVLVLPVLSALMRASDNSIRSVTTWEAVVITRIREAAPRMEPLNAWHIARGLIRAEMADPVDDRARDELHARVIEASNPKSDWLPYSTGVQSGLYGGTAAGTATTETPSTGTQHSAGAAIPDGRFDR